ncbi:MAG: serine hydrolase [Bacteroidota bacterium]
MHALCLALALAFAPAAAPDTSQALPRSTPEAEGIASSALLTFVEALDTQVDAMHSVMLVRNGQVIAEGWWTPYDAETPHVLYSLSKSFTATAVGLAIAEGKLSLDDRVVDAFPGEAPAEPSYYLQAMRLRDVLRMNTGHETEPSFWRERNTPGATWAERFFAHPVPFKPGTRFVYNSPATYMASAMVQQATGETVLEYLRPRLFEPLGFTDPWWMTSPEGITAGAFGLSATTEEIAKLGQLYLQHGAWNGEQLLPAAWVAEATRLQTANGSSPTSDWDQGYGYQFWRSRYDTYRGDGAFGQYCMVFPEHNAVLAMTAGTRDMQAVMNLVWEHLLPALSAEALDENPGAHAALAAKLGNLSVAVPSGEATSQAAEHIQDQWFAFPDNDRGLRAIKLSLVGDQTTLHTRTAAGEDAMPIGHGRWIKSSSAFSNGIGALLGVPPMPRMAASGAWTSDATFTLKLAAYGTPYTSTLILRFEDDRVVLESSYNVSFGPTELPPLTGLRHQD